MTTTIIPFHELVPGSEGVRFTTIQNVPYMSARDIIMVVCDKDSKRASETWINLPETFKNELSEFVGNFQFPGRGQSPQPVITLPGALKLIMWLPGNMAKEFRSKACEILTRYLAGDASLVAEIKSNALSNAPVNEMARASLPENPRDPLLEQIATEVRHFAPTLKQMSDTIVSLQARCDRESHLRHQADGRYGSDIRQANQVVRREAAFWQDQAKKFEELCDTRNNQLMECHRILVDVYKRNGRERSRSPRNGMGDDDRKSSTHI